MRASTLLATAAALTAVSWISLYAESVKFNEFDKSKPVGILTPAFGDTVTKAKFNLADFLKYDFNGDFTTVAEGTTATDKKGWLHLPKPAQNAEITSLKTNIRASRYAKGKLSVTSPLPFEVMADGKSIGKKESVEDSISDASNKKFDLELQPQYTTEIIIKTVSAHDGKTEPVINVEFIPDENFKQIEYAVDPAMKKRFSIKTTVDGPRVTSAKLSPDGKYIITEYSHTFDPKNVKHWAELSEVKTGNVLNADLNPAAFWMPKGNKIGYLENNDDKWDIYTVSVPTMTRSLFAAKIPSKDFEIAPDESYIIYYENVEGITEKGPLRRVKAPDDRIPGNRNRVYLMKYSIRDGIAQPLTSGGSNTILQDFSADSRKILFLSTRETPDHYPFYASDLIQLDVNTLKTDTIAAGEGNLAGAIYSPDAKQIFAWGGPSSFNGIGAAQGNHSIPNDFDTQGYIINVADKSVKPVTKDFDPAINGTPVWNPVNGEIFFRAYDKFYTPLYSYNPKTDKFTRLKSDVDKVLTFSIGDNEGRYVAYTGQSYTYAGALYLLDLKTGKNTILEDPLKEDMQDVDWGNIENRPFVASDGTTIDANVIYPPHFDPTKKYPMIVYYYGGTLPSDRTIGTPYTPQLFASRDYIVYVINPSGAIGYGQEFSARHVNAWGKRTADDIVEGINNICDEIPAINKDKIGCLGASYGGFMTQYLVSHYDLFAAAVSHAGISNITSYWGEGYWGYSYNAVAAAKSYPWTNPELFTVQSPLFNADKIHTPLLLLHGEVDTNVPIGESIQLFNALKILGRDVELITVEGQNHIILDYEKRVLWHATIMAWFAKWLQDDPSWWNSIYPD